ncbi:MAG: hypothetical protein K0R09_166 [Clostridiales bacterium]|jgi:gamma-glutamyl phosphate reductase|nr:hypothetical protein [Clostridiales bacterium]
MSHKNANKTEEDVNGLGYELDNGIFGANGQDIDIANNEKSEESSINSLEVRVERLKNDVKNLKKIKKQQEKLGKLEGKKLEILNEIEKEQEREKRSKHRHDKRKR